MRVNSPSPAGRWCRGVMLISLRAAAAAAVSSWWGDGTWPLPDANITDTAGTDAGSQQYVPR